jgi:aldehyde:ferredoxin oxidoreductase
MVSFPNAKILDINLTNQNVTVRTLPGDIYRLYPGGSALGMYLMLQDMKPKIDPLSPENMLIFSVSPVTGLPISGQSRMVVTTKSPLTGTAGDSQAGGFMPAHIKANGYDSIIFRGKAEKPVYIYIDGDNVEIKDAKNIWGKLTGEVEGIIKEELNENRVEIAQIGPAGEKLVKYACIMNMCNRANGRNGVGAVMGSKNLKAVVVKKSKTIKPIDPDNFRKLTKNVKERIEQNETISFLGLHGTDSDLEYHNQEGFLPTKNWQTGVMDNSEKITGSTMTDTILLKRDTCHACAIRCKRVVEIPGKVDPLYGGPEYETCAAFGSYCGNTNLETIAVANQICNAYGIDTISCGATIAFAMECYEKGLINSEDTDGLKLEFSNSEVIPIIAEMIGKREGIGDLLAEGSYMAAKRIGKDAVYLSMTCKGQEMPAHMPRGKQSLALIYAVNPFGADHQSSEHDPMLMMPSDSQERRWMSKIGCNDEYDEFSALDEGKVRLAFNSQRFLSLLDTLSLCQFAWGAAWQLYGPSDLVDMLKYGIDWDTSIYELMLIGERRINMMRYFNSREGFTSEDDAIPERLFESLPEGPQEGAKINKEEFKAAKKRYYEMAGWDVNTGNPTNATLKNLQLEWLLERK